MNKLVPIALAFLSLTAVPGVSMAMNTRRSLSVTETGRGRDTDVGTIRFTLEGAEEREDFEGQSVSVCRYVGRWTNGADSPSRTNLFVDEIATPGYEDCEENSREFFDTLVFLAPDERSRGFDPQQQRRIIDNLFLQESEDGTLEGVIEFANGNSYRIAMER